MTQNFLTGRHDSIKRRVYEVPLLDSDRCAWGYVPVMLELYPGKFVRQIVGADRIQKRAETGK